VPIRYSDIRPDKVKREIQSCRRIQNVLVSRRYVALQSRLLPAIPPNRHQITLLVREADLFLFPESDLLAVALQPVNHPSQRSGLCYSHLKEPGLPLLGATYFSLSTLGSITTFSVLKSAVQQ
jgi:hypothetical protein